MYRSVPCDETIMLLYTLSHAVSPTNQYFFSLFFIGPTCKVVSVIGKCLQQWKYSIIRLHSNVIAHINHYDTLRNKTDQCSSIQYKHTGISSV